MRGRFIVGTAFAAAIGYFMFANPDAGFRSSDGNWADREFQSRGRHFRAVVILFEDYRLKCHAPEAVLLRATQRSWINVFAWPSYLADHKWRVHFSTAHPEIGDNYPPANKSNCANEGSTSAILHQAEANADRYIANL